MEARVGGTETSEATQEALPCVRLSARCPRLIEREPDRIVERLGSGGSRGERSQREDPSGDAACTATGETKTRTAAMKKAGNRFLVAHRTPRLRPDPTVGATRFGLSEAGKDRRR